MIRFKLFLELFGSFNYEIPSDKEMLIFDFYMLVNLKGSSSYSKKLSDAGYISASIPKSDFRDMDEEGKIDYMLDEVANKLLPRLKLDLLEGVFFALSNEFHHIKDSQARDKEKIVKSDIIDAMSKHLDDDSLGMLRSYLDKVMVDVGSRYSSNSIDDALKYVKHPDLVDSNLDKKINYFYASRVASEQRDKFVRLMRSCFEHLSWVESYGGKNWVNIADAWLRLNRSSGYNDLVIAIDHIFDIQHNTGSIFNKIESYAKEGDYYNGIYKTFYWINNALTTKAEMKNPYELINLVSPGFRELAIRAIKRKTGQSLEDFNDLNVQNPWDALAVAKRKGRPVPELEDMIVRNNKVAIKYTRDILRGRFPKLEARLLDDFDIDSFNYVKAIKGRWPELEKKYGHYVDFWDEYSKALKSVGVNLQYQKRI